MLEQIYEKYYGTMLYIAENILYDRATAEDAVSEAFIKMGRHVEKLQDASPYQQRAYIAKAVKTVALDFYNKQTRRNEIEEDFENFSASDISTDILWSLLRKEGYEALKAIVQTLPDHMKDVLLLHANGYSHDEIAKALGISVSNSKKRLSRAREFVKKRLAGKHD
ncbi:MAG: sigma-70 family RNA polymerase sigma factor [Defluviitaleaceae bacterium]|nr:sigma-70 family RNA polymerase sigma factor [Defluviitaleaceae bacterium]